MSDEQHRDNTVPMQPGRNGGRLKVGNPGNAGKTVSLVEEMKRKLRDDPKAKDAIIAASYARACEGDARHLEIWLSRVDGPVQQQVDVTSGGDKVQITFGMPVVVEEGSEA